MLLHFILVLLALRLTLMPLAEGYFVGATTTTAGNLAKPGCRSQCGNLTVPYPFGLEKGCSIDESFELTCNLNFNPPKLFSGSGSIEIYSINISGSDMKVSTLIVSKCYNESGANGEEFKNVWVDLSTPFSFSDKNKFTVVGCYALALISGTTKVNFTGSCVGSCSKESDAPNGESSGIGCCQTSIPNGVKNYQIDLTFVDIYNRTEVQPFMMNPCVFAFLGDEHSFTFRGERDVSNATEFYDRTRSVPMVVDWVIGGNKSCKERLLNAREIASARMQLI